MGQFLIGVLAVVFLCQNAYAYIDPGSGALIWQMLVAASFGCLFYFKKIRTVIKNTVKSLISRLKTLSKDGKA